MLVCLTVRIQVGSKQQAGASTSTARVTSVEEAFGILSVGFLRGGIGGFLKSGTAAVAGGQKEIRIGVTLVSTAHLTDASLP